MNVGLTEPNLEQTEMNVETSNTFNTVGISAHETVKIFFYTYMLKKKIFEK